MKPPSSPLRRLPLALLVTGAITISALAQNMVPLDFRFARIQLANGRVLQDAALTGINQESGLIYVMEDRKLKPYPAALFPGFVTDVIAQRVAEYPTTSRTKAAPPPAPPAPRPETAKGIPADTTPAAIEERAYAIEEAVAAKAQTAALRHFRYNQRTGSGYATTTKSEVDLDRPETIAGWSHRYRVKGTVYFSFYDSVGEVFQNRSRGVEVILEAPGPRSVKVLEVNTDWSPAR